MRYPDWIMFELTLKAWGLGVGVDFDACCVLVVILGPIRFAIGHKAHIAHL